MKKEAKEESFELSYLQEEKNKKVKKKKKIEKIEKEEQTQEIFNENEIIIGIPKIEPDQKQKEKVKPKNVVKTNKQKKKQQNTKKNKKNARIRNKIIKYSSIFILLLAGILYGLLSPVFDIQEIEVNNEKQITKEQIVSLTKIQLGENIFRISKKEIIEKIKQNAYIESVIIKRKLPDKISITIEERIPTFMLEYGNAYLYLNNQGYILETSTQEISAPKIIGYDLPEDKCTPGNRLEKSDLEKLETVLKIMEIAKNNGLEEKITQIDIKDEQNYIIYMQSEEKTVYLGENSNLSTKILYLKAILEKEKDRPGEIFLNINLNTDNAYFREQV